MPPDHRAPRLEPSWARVRKLGVEAMVPESGRPVGTVLEGVVKGASRERYEGVVCRRSALNRFDRANLPAHRIPGVARHHRHLKLVRSEGRS